jgi:hypothetical protein
VRKEYRVGSLKFVTKATASSENSDRNDGQTFSAAVVYRRSWRRIRRTVPGTNSPTSTTRRSPAGDQQPSLRSKDEARRMAVNFAKLPELLQKS